MTTKAQTVEILKANTRKTSSLLKKFFKQKYNVNATIRSEKFAGGTSIDISYMCGPESKDIELELSGMVYGSFNSMEDIYINDSDRVAFVFEGYELETFKYMHIEQKLPETMKMEMAILADNNTNFPVHSVKE